MQHVYLVSFEDDEIPPEHRHMLKDHLGRAVSDGRGDRRVAIDRLEPTDPHIAALLSYEANDFEGQP
jgi:hypothetical protein